MQQLNPARMWPSEKRSSDARPHKATARRYGDNFIRRMTGRFAMIIGIVTVLAVIPLQPAYAVNAQIKFSDPDFQTNVPSAGPSVPAFVDVNLAELDVTFRCCPRGNKGGNRGCQDQIARRIHEVAGETILLDASLCKPGTCKIRVTDIVVLDELADFLQKTYCGGLVIPRITVGGETVPEMFFTFASFDLTGVIGTLDACTATPPCPVYFIGHADFILSPPFSFATLPMSGTFNTPLIVDCNETRTAGSCGGAQFPDQ